MPHQPRAAGRPDALLDRLLTLFLAEGFAAFSVQDLAQRMRCSKTTLYAVAPSKEQIVVATVREFFKRAASHVEAQTSDAGEPLKRIDAYLRAVAGELEPASPAFYADVAAFAPAYEIYQRNTVAAARRVQDLVEEGVQSGAIRPVNAGFVGAAARHVMTAIHHGEIRDATGLDDADAYRALADLVVAGVAKH